MKNGIVLALAVWWAGAGAVSLAEGGAVARIGPSGDQLELSRQADGRTVVEVLPLHRVGEVRYFSAGVGFEERAAEYPPFPLKLVLTAGGKPYLAGATVRIAAHKNATVLTIPREHVEGPWLFVDLPPGSYDITATHGNSTQILGGIKVEAGKQKTVYVRWPEDPGLAVNLPAE
jgi:hypothetical protein